MCGVYTREVVVSVVVRESRSFSVAASYSDHSQNWGPANCISMYVNDPRDSGRIEGLVEI